MRYLALAVDYDGTAAHDDELSDSAEQAIERLRVSGRRSRHRTTVLDVVRELGLELQAIFNRSAMMLLPPGTTKATGLDVALRRFGLSRHEAVGIGDAENDHSFLTHCECGVAVANAVESLKKAAAFVTQGSNGNGVAELADELVANDLLRMEGKIERHLDAAICQGSSPDRPFASSFPRATRCRNEIPPRTRKLRPSRKLYWATLL